jgi:hypothetical protein
VCNLKKFFCLEKVFVNEETSERFLNVQTEAKNKKQKQRIKTEAKKRKQKLSSKMIRHLRVAAPKRFDLSFFF